MFAQDERPRRQARRGETNVKQKNEQGTAHPGAFFNCRASGGAGVAGAKIAR
jgi:hypothetical protein